MKLNPIRVLAASSTFRSSVTLLIVAIIILAGAGHLARSRNNSKLPSRVLAPVPSPPIDWTNVDREIVNALTVAHKAAETAATAKLDSWLASLMRRVDSDFLPWFFSYWTQQTLGLKSAWFWATQQLGLSDYGPGEFVAWEVQRQFSQRVVRPEIAQLELERITNETIQVFVDELNPKLAAIPKHYRIPQPEWDHYLSNIAVMTARVDGNRQTTLTLKTVAASTAVGGVMIARSLSPEIKTIAARVTGKVSGSAASELAARSSGGIAAKFGGESMGEIIGVVVILWDVVDHFLSKQTELPVLQKNIRDYLEEVKQSLLHDPEHGILTTLDSMENTIVASLRTKPGSARELPK